MINRWNSYQREALLYICQWSNTKYFNPFDVGYLCVFQLISFGYLYFSADFDVGSLCRSYLRVMCASIIDAAQSMAVRVGAQHVYFIGSFITHPFTRSMFDGLIPETTINLGAVSIDSSQAAKPEIRPCPTNTRRWPNVGLMLVQRRRRWANMKPTLGRRHVFAGYPAEPDVFFLSMVLLPRVSYKANYHVDIFEQ